MSRDVYQVTVRREDPWWVGVVQGVGATETRTIANLEEIVRDLVVVATDLSLDDEFSFDLEWSYDLPAAAAAALEDYQRARQERAAIEERYEKAAVRAAESLENIRVSGRDAARIMGLSHQRVQQIRASGKGRKSAA